MRVMLGNSSAALAVTAACGDSAHERRRFPVANNSSSIRWVPRDTDEWGAAIVVYREPGRLRHRRTTALVVADTLAPRRSTPRGAPSCSSSLLAPVPGTDVGVPAFPDTVGDVDRPVLHDAGGEEFRTVESGSS